MKHRSVLVSAFIGLLISALVGGASSRTAAQPAVSLEAPKWDIGDRWTWQLGKDTITSVVIGVTGGYVTQEKGDDPSDNRTLHFGPDLSSTDTHIEQFQFPMVVGKTWAYIVESTYSGRPTKFKIDRKVEAMDSLTVPAGTFDALRITGHDCNLTTGGCGDFIVWYASKAKNFAKIAWGKDRFWGKDLNGASQVLISYELHNP